MEPNTVNPEPTDHSFSRVTPLSRYLIVALLVILPLVGFWIGVRYGQTSTESLSTPEEGRASFTDKVEEGKFIPVTSTLEDVPPEKLEGVYKADPPVTLSGVIKVYNYSLYDGTYVILFTPDASSLAKLPIPVPGGYDASFYVENGEAYVRMLCGDACPNPPPLTELGDDGLVIERAGTVAVINIDFGLNPWGKGDFPLKIIVSTITAAP